MNPNRPLTPLARLGWSLGAGLPVTLAILGCAVVVTLAMPSTYQSRARVLVRTVIPTREPSTPAAAPTTTPDPFAMATELEVASSVRVLTEVIEKLSLNERWSREYLRQGTLQTPESVAILRDRIAIRQLRNTPVLEFSAYGTDRQLAADIANALAETYLSVRRPGPGAVAHPGEPVPTSRPSPSIIDLAEPGLKPVRPNVPLNLLLGALGGGGAGLLTAGMVWLGLRRRSRPGPLPSLA